MINVLILLGGIFGCAVGRAAFGRWFNHVTIYSFIWSATLVLFELRFINYYVLESETWFIMITGWIAFVIGSITVVAARWARGEESARTGVTKLEVASEDDLKRVRRILWVLNVISLLAALHNIYLITRLFGSLSNAMTLGNLLYTYRISHGGVIQGSIPYVAFIVYNAALLAGYYTAHVGKLTIMAVIPLIVVIMLDFTNMGRVNILAVMILFTSSYFLTTNLRKSKATKLGPKLRRLLIVAVVVAIVVSGAEFIRSSRKPSESFAGSSRSLMQLRTAKFITPSIYLYFTANYGVLNQFYKNQGENTLVGGHTFSSVYKLLEKFGFDTHVESYQAGYRTPVWSNTGTILRELSGDFGLGGPILGTYLLGLLTSVFWFKLQTRGRFIDLSIAGFFFVIVGMSIFVMASRVGAFQVYLIASFVISSVLDVTSSTANRGSAG